PHGRRPPLLPCLDVAANPSRPGPATRLRGCCSSAPTSRKGSVRGCPGLTTKRPGARPRLLRGRRGGRPTRGPARRGPATWPRGASTHRGSSRPTCTPSPATASPPPTRGRRGAGGADADPTDAPRRSDPVSNQSVDLFVEACGAAGPLQVSVERPAPQTALRRQTALLREFRPPFLV